MLQQAVSFISFIFVVVSTVGMILNTLPSVQATVGPLNSIFVFSTGKSLLQRIGGHFRPLVLFLPESTPYGSRNHALNVVQFGFELMEIF
jgi:hypothetical protein